MFTELHIVSHMTEAELTPGVSGLVGVGKSLIAL